MGFHHAPPDTPPSRAPGGFPEEYPCSARREGPAPDEETSGVAPCKANALSPDCRCLRPVDQKRLRQGQGRCVPGSAGASHAASRSSSAPELPARHLLQVGERRSPLPPRPWQMHDAEAAAALRLRQALHPAHRPR